MPNIDAHFPKMLLFGRQYVSKYRQRPDVNTDEVYIVLALIRLGNVGTDVLISLNMPTSNSIKTYLDANPSYLREFTDVTTMTNPHGSSDTFQSNNFNPFLPMTQLMRNLLHSFSIRDWSLFGQSH